MKPAKDTTKTKDRSHPLIEIHNINQLQQYITQCGYNSPTVELSQMMNNFQQQQTGRLL